MKLNHNKHSNLRAVPCPVPKPFSIPIQSIQGPPGPPGTTCIRTNPDNGCSVAEGNGTLANGFASHAEGCGSVANGDCSHAEGRQTVANGTASHSEGQMTQANGDFSHAEGNSTEASGIASHAEGAFTTASGDASHAEGALTTASGGGSHAEGAFTVASGDSSHAEGISTRASEVASHAEGLSTQANAQAAHAEGSSTEANGDNSHAEGLGTKAIGDNSHTEGSLTQANGIASHAEGNGTTANGDFSHAEGVGTTTGLAAQAAHAEGNGTEARGPASHAEGFETETIGFASHAEGFETEAIGFASHAEGFSTIADGNQSHTEGVQTCANGFTGVHVMGQNGGPNPVVDLPFSWYLVNGAFQCDPAGVVAKILSNGSACFDSTVTAGAYVTAAGACDYAEMFETINGQPIDVGYFVTFDGASDKIRKANANDDYILGVASSRPGILADTEDPTCAKYLLDEWNREIYEEIVIEAVTDKDGNVIMPERVEMRKKLNPAWDPNTPCSSRLNRPEWVAVGLVGKLLVRDDGTCQVGGYCRPNNEGIATATTNGYRVMKRTGPNQIMILVR